MYEERSRKEYLNRPMNRHERRRAASLARKKHPPGKARR